MAADLLGSMRVEIVGDNKKLDNSIDESQKKTKKFSKASVIAYAAIATAIVALGAKAVKAFAIQEQAEAKLNQTIKSTGEAAGLTFKQLTDMASGLQAVTKFGDEAIIGAETLLLTFKDIGGDVFPRALESILDVSEAMGTGLKESSIQVGKALNDPIQGLTALRRVGIQFSDAQEELIKGFVKSNDLASAQGIILTELESQFGGVARAAADTASGSLTQLSNSLGDLEEQLGQTVAEGLQPMAKATTSIIDNLVEWIKKNREVNNFLKEFSEGNEDAAAGVDTLAASLSTLQARLTQAEASGRADTTNLKEQISQLQILIAQRARGAALEAQFAGAKAANDKAAATRLEREIEVNEAEIEISKITEQLRQDALTDSEMQIELLQAQIDKWAEFRDVVGGQDLLNELVRQRNVLLEDEGDILEGLEFDWESFDEKVIDGLANQSEGVKELTLDYQALAENGVDSFASAFQRAGEAGVSTWDLVKQAGKDAISTIILAQAKLWGLESAAAFLRLNIPAGVGFLALAAGANAASGLVQNLGDGGIVAGSNFIGGDTVPAMLTPGEVILNQAQQARTLMAIANGTGNTTNNNNSSININSMFSLGNDAKLNQAAEALFPALQKVGRRRGTTIGGLG